MLLTHRLFLLPALGPLIYNLFIILSGVLFSRQLGIASLAYGEVAGAFLGIFLISAIGAARKGIGYHISFEVKNCLSGVGEAFCAADGWRFAGQRRRLDSAPLCF